MATAQELSDFHAGVERRAFKQTVYAVRDDHAALDIVQDAMLKLAEKYVSRPVEEYPMLFQRILQNTMRDYWRRDPLVVLGSEDNSDTPDTQVERSQTIAIIENALQELPTRQREAFILRYWEDMDVAETAAAMGCSQGSVKTHCSRAVRALASILEKNGISKEELGKSGVER